jgi:biotin operon repressor
MMKNSAPLETSSRFKARTSPPASASDDFASSTQTRALLAGSQAARLARLEAGDMVSTDEAAAMTGTSRVTINAWISKGRAIGLSQAKRGYRMPQWQFDSRMWEALPRLSNALGTTEGWALLSFLETPLGALQGSTPRQAIEQGTSARVIELAAAGDL